MDTSKDKINLMIDEGTLIYKEHSLALDCEIAIYHIEGEDLLDLEDIENGLVAVMALFYCTTVDGSILWLGEAAIIATMQDILRALERNDMIPRLETDFLASRLANRQESIGDKGMLLC